MRSAGPHWLTKPFEMLQPLHWAAACLLSVCVRGHASSRFPARASFLPFFVRGSLAWARGRQNITSKRQVQVLNPPQNIGAQCGRVTKPTAAAPKRAAPLTWRCYCRNYCSQSTALCFNVQTESLAGTAAAHAGVCSFSIALALWGRGAGGRNMKGKHPEIVLGCWCWACKGAG